MSQELSTFDVSKYIDNMNSSEYMNTMKSSMRLFNLRRSEDVSGISGTGTIAEGVEFTDGTCVIKWLTHTSSINIFPNVKELMLVHGHEGKTVIEYANEGSFTNNKLN